MYTIWQICAANVAFNLSSFLKWFQSYVKRYKTIMANTVHLKCLS